MSRYRPRIPGWHASDTFIAIIFIGVVVVLLHSCIAFFVRVIP